MAFINTQDSTGRPVLLSVQPMVGAILNIVRTDRGHREHRFTIALTPDECRALAADFLAGHASVANVSR